MTRVTQLVYFADICVHQVSFCLRILTSYLNKQLEGYVCKSIFGTFVNVKCKIELLSL